MSEPINTLGNVINAQLVIIDSLKAELARYKAALEYAKDCLADYSTGRVGALDRIEALLGVKP